MKCRKGLALRVFEYAAALAAEHGLPAASTAMILTGPAPASLLHEERVGGRVVCWRRIPPGMLWKYQSAPLLSAFSCQLYRVTELPPQRWTGAFSAWSCSGVAQLTP